MAVKNTVGPLIKEARTKAGMTQEQLAGKIDGATASDISKAERGGKMLTLNQLKQIAKATGVTQKSLLDAAKASETAAAATTTAGKTSGKTSGTTGKTSGKASMELTGTERKLIELYRAADSDKKKVVMSLLKGETQTTNEMLTSLLDGSKKPDEIVTSLIGNLVEGFANKK